MFSGSHHQQWSSGLLSALQSNREERRERLRGRGTYSTASDCLDLIQRPGPTAKLSEAEKVHLAATVRRGYDTRQMKLVDIRREAGLNHVCDTTVLRALKEMGIKPYREEFKFIFTQENMAIRKVGVEIPTKEKN